MKDVKMMKRKILLGYLSISLFAPLILAPMVHADENVVSTSDSSSANVTTHEETTSSEEITQSTHSEEKKETEKEQHETKNLEEVESEKYIAIIKKDEP
ncbi:hypothetical protein, partial [Vagococcus silagei]|uniref:hypothetical protein n=1 Tax=Vagococcus silagei TaxID=2508885 RepID=UPI00194FDAA7